MFVFSATKTYRDLIRYNYLLSEKEALFYLLDTLALSAETRADIRTRATGLVRSVRNDTVPGLMEAFLAKYGLDAAEGVALMSLAEALLRVPDTDTMDALLKDKIADGAWLENTKPSRSVLLGLSSYSLSFIAALWSENAESKLLGLRRLIARIGAPAVRMGAKLMMKELGQQFVLGETIETAIGRSSKNTAYRHSFDMLGEAARTWADADTFFASYKKAIEALGKGADTSESALYKNSGISIKLSALHPRYEWGQRKRVLKDLVPRVIVLCEMARAANISLTIDAEEAERLELSLDVIEKAIASPSLSGWNGFGIVVQAYSKRAPFVLDYLYSLAAQSECRFAVRLVKGAYWDSEIKLAQVKGLVDYPVYTKKAHSDVSYAACVKQLRGMLDRLYPQFATHNAQSVATVLEFFKEVSPAAFEFQRLHGMGESLYKVLKAENPELICRIYAPVGEHEVLLAYLVRRLLENGANSSFVNQLFNAAIPAEDVVKDPITAVDFSKDSAITFPVDLFGDTRLNSKGWDITDVYQMKPLQKAMKKLNKRTWQAAPLLALPLKEAARETGDVINPADPSDKVGEVILASAEDVHSAFRAANVAFADWSSKTVEERSSVLLTTADMLEENTAEIFVILTREAGKSLPDAIAEIREAVDFLRYYAVEAGSGATSSEARGVIGCISPWNFPLAIFVGQIAAALVSGNTVLAKPAEQTPIVASFAVKLFRKAGVPAGVLQLLPGAGERVGQAIVSNPDIAGVCFTGSTATAQHINRALARHAVSQVPLVAETGGLNAMIVDSTALPEQTVRDIVMSAFQSAGQRCSALRLLYVQEDVKDHILTMLYGAMDALNIGNPADISTDVGPVIDQDAQQEITAYIENNRRAGNVLKEVRAPKKGRFIAPTVVKVQGIEDMQREIFGPVLHVATYKASDLPKVIAAINAKGFGLTLGMHSRIEARLNYVRTHAHVGNMYINRNQIGAIVGSQPFGGEGLSGTGPKAGGPRYLSVFRKEMMAVEHVRDETVPLLPLEKVQAGLDAVNAGPSAAFQPDDVLQALCSACPAYETELKAYAKKLAEGYQPSMLLPGPVGEDNTLRIAAKGTILCMGPGQRALAFQLLQALYFGNRVLVITKDQQCASMLNAFLPDASIMVGSIEATMLQTLQGFEAIACAGGADQRGFWQALSSREGALLPLIPEIYMPYRYIHERHICTDTTAAGGNVALYCK